MLDAIVGCKPIESSDVHCTVVHDNFYYSSPSAQDVFKDEGAKGTGIPCTKCIPFRPSGEQAASLHDVVASGSGWHEHSVDVHLVEEWGWDGDSWQDSDFGCLVDLTFLTCCNVLFAFLLSSQPPPLGLGFFLQLCLISLQYPLRDVFSTSMAASWALAPLTT